MIKNIALSMALGLTLTFFSSVSQAGSTCKYGATDLEVQGVALPDGRAIIMGTSWTCSGNEQAITYSLHVRGDAEAVLVAKTTDVPATSTSEAWASLIYKTVTHPSPAQGDYMGFLAGFISQYKEGKIDRDALEGYFRIFIRKANQIYPEGSKL